jgi:hypothetical protein
MNTDGPEDDDSGLTPVQVQIRDKAWEMLNEHFDGVILVFDTEVNEGTDRAFQCNYHGGITVALGLCERAKKDLLNRGLTSDKE